MNLSCSYNLKSPSLPFSSIFECRGHSFGVFIPILRSKSVYSLLTLYFSSKKFHLSILWFHNQPHADNCQFSIFILEHTSEFQTYIYMTKEQIHLMSQMWQKQPFHSPRSTCSNLNQRTTPTLRPHSVLLSVSSPRLQLVVRVGNLPLPSCSLFVPHT